MTVMVGMWEGGGSPFYILQLPINRPMAALLVASVVGAAAGGLRTGSFVVGVLHLVK